MAIIQTGTSLTGVANVDESFAVRMRDAGGPNPFYCNAVTGTMLAASNGDVYAMRLDPAAANPAHITSVRCWYRTITGFTVPATFRAFRMRRFSGAVASGGTNLPTAALKNGVGGAASEFNLAGGGDLRISSTTVLTSPGSPETFEVAERVNVAAFGQAVEYASWAWDFCPAQGRAPLILAAGQSLAIGTTAAFDAAGTWEFGCHVEWFEGRAQG
jgi:hypothetical protein